MRRFWPSGGPVPTRRWWRRLRLTDVLVASALPLIAAVYLLAGAMADHQTALLFDDWWAQSRTVINTFSARAAALRHAPRAIALNQRLDPSDPDPAVVSLLLPRAAWDSIAADPLVGFDQWVDATVDRGDSQESVRLRRRGDTSVHWTTPKISFTLRTTRGALFKGYRTLGFSGKDVLPAWLANDLAQDFGLLAPTTSVAPVFLNRRFYGIYRVLEPPDESFLRLHMAMPGNLYRADAAERGEYFKGVPRNVFANPVLWDRPARSDRPTGPATTQVAAWLHDVNGTTLESHRQLMARFDREEIARLVALLLLTGDPYHMDDVHNQLWYEAPATGLLHPVPWDTRLLDLAHPEKQVSSVLQAVLRDPYVVAGALAETHRRLTEGLVDSAATRAQAMWQRFADYFQYDRLRAGMIPDVGTPEAAVATLRGNAALLAEWVADARIGWAAGPAGQGQVFDLVSTGLAGAELVALALPTWSGPLPKAQLRRDANGNGVLDPTDPAVPGAWQQGRTGIRFAPTVVEPLWAAWRTDAPGIEAGVQHYRYFLDGTAPAGLAPVLRNRITGAAVTAVPLDPGSPLPAATGWPAWRLEARRPTSHRWAGTVRLTETLALPAGDTLVIAPGTTVLLGPDVSLVVAGPLTARGTAAAPIRFAPLDPARPWGAFVLQGVAASGSVVEHASFRSGGGALLGRIEYTGMVNVHLARGVVFRHVAFLANRRSDDTFRALLAEVTVTDSRFEDANSDAVDLDMSEGTLVGNWFRHSGGDAIDLMTSTPVIAGNHIVGSGDKGISVGEASRPIIVGNYIADGLTGVEAKDNSQPWLLDNVIEGNATGLNQKLKNWRYGAGGHARWVRGRLQGNAVNFGADGRSLLALGAATFDSAGGLRSHEPLGSPHWLYRAAGLEPFAPAVQGAVLPRPVESLAPLAQETWHDDFGPRLPGWTTGGGVRRLVVRGEALVASVRDTPGQLGRSVDWDLSGRPGGGDLVLELGGEDLLGLTVTVIAEDGAVHSRPVNLAAEGAQRRLVTLHLPPGRYRSLLLEATPRPRIVKLQQRTGLLELVSAQVRLNGYWLY